MKTAWTQHLKDPQEKEEFEKYVNGSRRLFDRLAQIIQDYEDELSRGEISPRTFDETPNWALKQAYVNGHKYGLSIIKDLINLD